MPTKDHGSAKPPSYKKVAIVGLFAALALVLGFIESMIPPIAFLPPGVKIGLSNVVVMFAAIWLGSASALFIAIIKAAFSLLLRGYLAAILSFCGGIFSVLVISLLLLKPKWFGLLGISVAGAVMHNFAQLLAVGIITASPAFAYYSPVLLLSGILMGTITALLLKLLLPLLLRAKALI